MSGGVTAPDPTGILTILGPDTLGFDLNLANTPVIGPIIDLINNTIIPGINGGLARPREGQSPGTINTIAVPSLDQSVKKIEQHGGKVCVPKMEIPSVGWLAYAEDPGGNIFGVIEPHPGAK